MDLRERVCLHFVGEEDLLDAVEPDQSGGACTGAGLGLRSSRRSGHSMRTLLTLSQADISEMMTWSPAERPCRISIVVTDARPNVTGTRDAVLLLGSSLNTPTVRLFCANAGLPTYNTFSSRSTSIVPSTLRSARAPAGSVPGSDTSTSTVPFCAAGAIRTTRPGTTPLRVSTDTTSPTVTSTTCVSGTLRSALSFPGWATLARIWPGTTHWPRSSDDSCRTPLSPATTRIDATRSS